MNRERGIFQILVPQILFLFYFQFENGGDEIGALHNGQLLLDAAEESHKRRQSRWKVCAQGRDITT
jgi:hypothetical protein